MWQCPVVEQYFSNQAFKLKGAYVAQNIDCAVYPLIPYSFKTMDTENANYISPFAKQKNKTLRNRHWLGTDEFGRDVLANIIHGLRNSLLISFIAVFISSLLAFLIGGFAGYLGNNRLKASVLELLSIAIFVFFMFYILYIYLDLKELGEAFPWLEAGVVVMILLSMVFFTKVITQKFFKKQMLPIPLGSVFSGLTDAMQAVPALFLMIPIAAVFKPSFTLVILVIGLTSWPSKARLVKGEMLRFKDAAFVEVFKNLGLSEFKVFFKHICPNIMPIFYSTVPFSIANAILAESALTFLGIGLPPDSTSLGFILQQALYNLSAWWVYVPASGCIIFIAYTFAKMGERVKSKGKSIFLE